MQLTFIRAFYQHYAQWLDENGVLWAGYDELDAEDRTTESWNLVVSLWERMLEACEEKLAGLPDDYDSIADYLGSQIAPLPDTE